MEIVRSMGFLSLRVSCLQRFILIPTEPMTAPSHLQSHPNRLSAPPSTGISSGSNDSSRTSSSSGPRPPISTPSTFAAHPPDQTVAGPSSQTQSSSSPIHNSLEQGGNRLSVAQTTSLTRQAIGNGVGSKSTEPVIEARTGEDAAIVSSFAIAGSC